MLLKQFLPYETLQMQSWKIVEEKIQGNMMILFLATEKNWVFLRVDEIPILRYILGLQATIAFYGKN